VDTNADLIERLFEIVDGRRWDELGGVFAADAVYFRPGYADITGLDELTHFYRDVRRIESGKHQLSGVLSDGRTGCCWGRFEGVDRAGEPLSEYFADWYTFTGPLIQDRRTFFFRPAI